MAKFSEIPEGLQYIIRATRNRMLSVTDRLMQSDRPENNSELLAYRKKQEFSGGKITIKKNNCLPKTSFSDKYSNIRFIK